MVVRKVPKRRGYESFDPRFRLSSGSCLENPLGRNVARKFAKTRALRTLTHVLIPFGSGENMHRILYTEVQPIDPTKNAFHRLQLVSRPYTKLRRSTKHYHRKSSNHIPTDLTKHWMREPILVILNLPLEQPNILQQLVNLSLPSIMLKPIAFTRDRITILAHPTI